MSGLHSVQPSHTLGALRIWRPSIDDPTAVAALARCLSSAFSSGIWQKSPMPVGGKHDPASALGIIDGLGPRPVAVAATPEQGRRVIGCAIGCIMDAGEIGRYHLADYGAEPGDGLLAFIGIVPEAQGVRVRQAGGTLEPARGAPSLARHLFTTWIESETIDTCPRLFIRTRRQIGQIRRLSEDLGFEFRGDFETEFRGQVQTRLVYCRPSGWRSGS